MYTTLRLFVLLLFKSYVRKELQSPENKEALWRNFVVVFYFEETAGHQWGSNLNLSMQSLRPHNTRPLLSPHFKIRKTLDLLQDFKYI